MKLLWSTLIIILITPVFLQAQPADSLFVQANQHYARAEYDTAIRQYQQILEKGLESAPLHFNLGNAYFKNQQLARAILHYERALRLDPQDADIRQNLVLARDQTLDQFETLPEPLLVEAYRWVLLSLNPGQWARLGLITLAFFIMGTALYLFSTWRRPGFILGLSGLILALLSFALASAHAGFRQNNQPAIVMVANSYAKSGPGEEAEDVFILHEGTKVLVTETYDQWRKVKLPDGKVGWLAAGDLEKI